MTSRLFKVCCQRLAWLAASAWLTSSVRAQPTVYFSTSDPGQTKAIEEWGTDTAWPSADNMRQSIAHMGLDEIDVVRLTFYVDEALQDDGEVGPRSKKRLDTQLGIAAMCGDKPLALLPNSADPTDASYLNGEEVQVDRWVQLLEATQRYIDKPIHAVEPFNEPDYWQGQGTPQNLQDILLQLQNSAAFSGTGLHAASTLDSDQAQRWYDVVSGPATHGTTHQLAGSTESYVRFIEHVKAGGDIPYNPELHSLAEAIYGAEYGLQGGIWWGAVQRARGLFVRACQGERLGYAEDRGRQSAAAVYRAADGKLRGFASCFERGGALTPYRFVSRDRDLWWNGIGPLREFMLPVTQGQDAYVDIDTTDAATPPLDGRRWQLVNVQSGLSLEVDAANRDDGGDIRLAADSGAEHQRWDITRTRDGYFTLTAAHSGRTAEVADGSTADGADVRQWGRGDNLPQHWFIDDAGDGSHYIRNAHSTQYMTRDGTDVVQSDAPRSDAQRWRFVPVTAAIRGTLLAHYAFEGDLRDSAGARHGATVGAAGYTTGALGRALELDGQGDYATVPSGVASSRDITLAAWVYWRGGAAWQRVFDLGDGTDRYLFLSPSSTTGTLRFAIKNGGDEEILDTDALEVNRWVHVAVTIGGHTGVLYVDGKPRVAGQILQDPSAIDAATSFIGKSQYTADPLFNGAIDDLRVYDGALDAQAIARLVAPPSSTELVAHLPFDETRGAIAADSSGNRFDGTLEGEPQWQSGAAQGALALDGKDDAVRLPAGVLTGLRDFTIEAWVYLDAADEDARIFDFGSSTAAHMYLTPRASSGALRYAITASGAADEQHIDGETALPTGVWTHVAVTSQDHSGVLYVDGKEVGRNTDLTLDPAAIGYASANYLGKSQSDDHYLGGAVDELKIISRALPAAELDAKRGAGTGASTAGEPDAGARPDPQSDAGVSAPNAGTGAEDAGHAAAAAHDLPRVIPRKGAGCSSTPGALRTEPLALSALIALGLLVLLGRRRRR
ncbi:MAG: LamG-like jellyroll fold domain-containing protein [Polyangiales bacterium]